jgi:hypothetical protein
MLQTGNITSGGNCSDETRHRQTTNGSVGMKMWAAELDLARSGMGGSARWMNESWTREQMRELGEPAGPRPVGSTAMG